MTRKRKLVGMVVGFTITASIAMAAWFTLGLIEGTGSTKTGKSTATTVNVKVVIHEGVTPTQEEPIEQVTVENTANPMTPTITTSNEGACPASNFSIVPDGPESFAGTKFWSGIEEKPHYENVNAGETDNLVGPGPSREMANLKMSAAAPTGCENVEVKMKVKIN
jgi:hypothetical protein